MKSKFNSNKNKLILIVFILLLIFLSLYMLNMKFKSFNKIQNINSNIQNDSKDQTLNKKEIADSLNLSDSSLSIPVINILNIPIKDGIDDYTLNEYIGHFPSTSKVYGNVGLAAHNRGYKNNYFKDINKLKNGDEIIYKIDNNVKTYKVKNKVEIDSYDWSYLNSTDDNRITLITCVKDKPNKRLVVQAVE